MDTRSFAAFLVVDLLLVMTPGADWAYAIAAGVRGSTVVPAIAGLAAGYVLRGSAVSGLNPKGLLLFFAVLPQFVAPDASWPMTAQLAVLGAVHVLACSVVYLAVALAARRLLRSRPRAARIVGRGSGVAMILVAVALTVERATLA